MDEQDYIDGMSMGDKISLTIQLVKQLCDSPSTAATVLLSSYAEVVWTWKNDDQTVDSLSDLGHRCLRELISTHAGIDTMPPAQGNA